MCDISSSLLFLSRGAASPFLLLPLLSSTTTPPPLISLCFRERRLLFFVFLCDLNPIHIHLIPFRLLSFLNRGKNPPRGPTSSHNILISNRQKIPLFHRQFNVKPSDILHRFNHFFVAFGLFGELGGVDEGFFGGCHGGSGRLEFAKWFWLFYVRVVINEMKRNPNPSRDSFSFDEVLMMEDQRKVKAEDEDGYDSAEREGINN